MKFYYFLHNLEKQDFEFFIERTWTIRSVADIYRFIDDYFFRIGDVKQGRTTSTAFLEVMLFLEFYLDGKHGDVEGIEWVYTQYFLVLNDCQYEFRGSSYARVDQEVTFVTTRDSWKNPFLPILTVSSWARCASESQTRNFIPIKLISWLASQNSGIIARSILGMSLYLTCATNMQITSRYC